MVYLDTSVVVAYYLGDELPKVDRQGDDDLRPSGIPYKLLLDLFHQVGPALEAVPPSDKELSICESEVIASLRGV